MWVWEHALFDYNPKRPDSTKKDKTVEVITKADHDAALRDAKAEGLAEMKLEANGSRAKSYIVETPYNEGHDAAIDNFVKWIDARAAQIEEGE